MTSGGRAWLNRPRDQWPRGREQQPPDGWHSFEQLPRPAGPAAALDLSATRPLRLKPVPAPRRLAPPGDHWLFLIVLAVAFVIFGATATGRVIFDTKLGVDIAAKEFLVRLWSLWNPLEWFGSLQDQYIGYAVPMAPFFLVGQLLHVPVWLIERAWLALLVAVGYTGMVRLARALRIGSDATRLLAAAVFVLWPTFTIVIGSTSAAALPGLIAPWAILPLIPAVQGRAGQAGAAARSGLAVAAMGGVNAVSTLAVLVLPALYIVTHTTGPQRRRLAVKWTIAVVAGTAWWLIPLLLQGRYSFNFLPYVEQATTTTRTMSAAAVLRGTGTWTAYFDLNGTPWLAAGWAIVTSAGAILASAAAAGTGLAGLARRDMPERRWLCISVGVVAVVALAGYYGPLGGPAHNLVASLLDGPLAPFRSLYKFEPVIAVALALGCGHVLERWGTRTLRLGRVKVTGAAATAPVVALVLVGLTLPQLTGKVLQQGSFSAIPSYWNQATAYLAAHSPRQTALVVPADPHGEFTWGDTIDNPMEPLATSPWAERALVPYGSAGSQVFLETAEQAIESGQQVPGLAAYLARAGIRYVLVRNDTSPAAAADYTPPQVVNETLVLSGFRRVAAFGPPVPVGPGYPNSAGLVPGLAASYPSVEIFTPDDGALQPASPVSALPANQTALVNGGPDALLQLDGQGVLGTRPAVIAGDKLTARPSLWAVTDGQRRADNDFGTTSNFQSYPYTATGTNPPDSPVGGAGAQPRQLLPVPAAGHQTVAVLTGASSVTASSAGTWLNESTLYDPSNAFDGDPNTAWAESDPATPIGQWIQIDFARTINLPSRAGIRLLTDSQARSVANELRVTTAVGSASTQTVDTSDVQRINIPPGRSSWLRITITGASNVRTAFPGAGITDVLIPGVKVTSYLEPAEDPAGQQAPAVSYSFSAPGPSPYQGAQASERSTEDLNRMFTTPATSALDAAITAVPVPGTALQSLISRLTPTTPGSFQVTASSSWNYLPALGPDNLVTTGTGLPWIAAAGDSQPQLKITWTGKRRIGEIVLTPVDGLAAAPTGVLVGSPAGDRLVNVGLGGVIKLSPPLRTDTLYLQFSALSASAAGNTAGGQPAQLPVGLSAISIPALGRLQPAVPAASTPFQLGCGQGPSVSVDGHRYQTSVTGTVGELTQLEPVQLQLCAPGQQLTLRAGQHRLTAAPSSEFTVTSLSLTSPGGATAAGPAASRRLRVLGWQADTRRLQIGPGETSYVEIHENFNPGWQATLNGTSLRAVRLDGWQQGFVVPAGQGGTITLTFRPATTYHVGIIASALALLALLAVAMGAPRRQRRPPGERPGDDGARRPQPAPRPAWTPARPVSPATSLASAHQGGRHRRPPAHGSLVWSPPTPSARARLGRTALVLLPLLVVVAVAGGPMVLIVPLFAIVGALRPGWLPGVAVAAMLTAGVIAAGASNPTALGSGTFSGPAQACALIALTAALLPAAAGSRADSRRDGPTR